MKQIYNEVNNNLSNTDSDILEAQYEKEEQIVNLMIELYELAVINDQKPLKERQDAAKNEDKWVRIETELDTGGIKKELREKLGPAYTDIKIALQFGDKDIPSNESKATGFQLPK